MLADMLSSSFSKSASTYTDIKPSNLSLDAEAVNIYLPAAIFTLFMSYTAGFILLAMKRFQIREYSLNWSLERDSFTITGERSVCAGRIASCAS